MMTQRTFLKALVAVVGAIAAVTAFYLAAPSDQQLAAGPCDPSISLCI
jgi:hypothetical protein